MCLFVCSFVCALFGRASLFLFDGLIARLLACAVACLLLRVLACLFD